MRRVSGRRTVTRKKGRRAPQMGEREEMLQKRKKIKKKLRKKKPTKKKSLLLNKKVFYLIKTCNFTFREGCW